MKTLKKTLCLILAVVMVVGVLILPANAASIKDYKDNEDIKYKEAVEVLSGLGILGGKDTGYFAPKGTLTRAEAAKIIAWMLLGKDAEKLHSNTQIFADVAADNWAAGYIAFCKNEGILAGDGAGNFRPNGELNGVDFGKMLLTALGYDAKLEGYVLNKDWDKNVTTQMLNKNSYIDIGTVLSNPMTREEAAQMAFLALQQSTVKYPTTIYGTSQSVLTGTTLGDRFGLERVKGVMTANEYADLDDDSPAGVGKSVIGGKTYNYASDLADIGETYEGWACGTASPALISLADVGQVGGVVVGLAADDALAHAGGGVIVQVSVLVGGHDALDPLQTKPVAQSGAGEDGLTGAVNGGGILHGRLLESQESHLSGFLTGHRIAQNRADVDVAVLVQHLGGYVLIPVLVEDIPLQLGVIAQRGQQHLAEVHAVQLAVGTEIAGSIARQNALVFAEGDVPGRPVVRRDVSEDLRIAMQLLGVLAQQHPGDDLRRLSTGQRAFRGEIARVLATEDPQPGEYLDSLFVLDVLVVLVVFDARCVGRQDEHADYHDDCKNQAQGLLQSLHVVFPP